MGKQSDYSFVGGSILAHFSSSNSNQVLSSRDTLTSGTLRSRRATAKETACPKLPESAILSRTENVLFLRNGISIRTRGSSPVAGRKFLAHYEQNLSKIGTESSGRKSQPAIAPNSMYF